MQHLRVAIGLTLGWIAGCSESADHAERDTARPAPSTPEAGLPARPEPGGRDAAAAPPDASEQDARQQPLDSATGGVADADASSRDANSHEGNANSSDANRPASSHDANSSDANSSDAQVGAGSDAAMGDAASCLRAPADYARPGSFGFSAVALERTKVWVPEVPEGCRVPIVHFANGTGATCAAYEEGLRNLASHGFLTVCAESTDTRDGAACVDAIADARARFPALAGSALGSAGHHTGGSGALLCLGLAQARWGDGAPTAGYAVAPVAGSGGVDDWMARYAELRAPLFFMRGSNDALVSKTWVKSGFDALSDQNESYWFEAVGANHIPLPLRWINETMVAWFRWKLLGDRAACRHLKALPALEQWELEAEQAPSDC